MIFCIFISSPGTYNPEIKPPPKVTWPMKFGAPDWAQVPCLQKRTLKTEVMRLGFTQALFSASVCVRGLNQGSGNKLQEVFLLLKVYVQFCVDMHMGIFLESQRILLHF